MDDHVDEAAANLRDNVIRWGFEPSNRDFIAGICYGRIWAAQMSSEHPPTDVFGNAVLHAEVCRRWLDGELPMVSISEMLGFGD